MFIRVLLPAPQVSVLLLTAGCAILDQRSFYPPARAGAAELSRAAVVDAPALSLRIGPAEPDWLPAVTALVEATQARQPNASYDIVAAIAPAGDAGGQAQAAREIAQAITSLGVLPSKVRLALRAEPDGRRDIRVFVR